MLFVRCITRKILVSCFDMGVNAVRLAHYPQATYMYDLMDKYGIVTWAEIPFVGPGGYADKGFVDQPSFRENGKEQLKRDDPPALQSS